MPTTSAPFEATAAKGGARPPLKIAKRLIKRTVTDLFEKTGLVVISKKTRDRIVQMSPEAAGMLWVPTRPNGQNAALDDDLRRTLDPTNPALADLRRRYKGHPAADHVQWDDGDVAHGVHMANFRGDNLYVFQTRCNSEMQYYLSTIYVAACDQLDAFVKLEEDGAFGAAVYEFDGRSGVSRDLLDSVLEMNFLERQLALSKQTGLTVLDIGAGYGRLAHRMVETFPTIHRYYCADAVATSTYLCDFYLTYRGVQDRARSVPLDRLEPTIAGEAVDLAINIHSFSECKRAVIRWWLDLVAARKVRWLMIVPNTGNDLTSTEPDGTRQDFRPDIEARGYRLKTMRPKYEFSTSMQKFALYPSAYFLFERAD